VNKEVTEIADEALDVLKRWEWPGNVRELQNVIERAVIRSSGPRLELPIEELMARSCSNAATTQTLAETERGLILSFSNRPTASYPGRTARPLASDCHERHCYPGCRDSVSFSEGPS
jgi:chemotaxis protein methyltransferase CheR